MDELRLRKQILRRLRDLLGSLTEKTTESPEEETTRIEPEQRSVWEKVVRKLEDILDDATVMQGNAEDLRFLIGHPNARLNLKDLESVMFDMDQMEELIKACEDLDRRINELMEKIRDMGFERRRAYHSLHFVKASLARLKGLASERLGLLKTSDDEVEIQNNQKQLYQQYEDLIQKINSFIDALFELIKEYRGYAEREKSRR